MTGFEDGVRVHPGHIGELAWILVEVMHVAGYVRGVGRCLGEIRARDVLCSLVTIHRRPSRQNPIDELLSRAHERWGHDRGCERLGVSERVLRKFVSSHANIISGSGLLIESIDELFLEIELAHFSRPGDAFEWLVRTRVTPVVPRDPAT